MNRMAQRIDRVVHGSKRQMLTVAAVAFIVYVLLVSGIFSYFHSEDAVTNRLDAKSGSVTIQEPKWDSTGQYKAKASEPGMEIEKDPYGYNNGQVDLYIRLKMTINASSYTKKNDTYNETYHYSESYRINAILDQIQLEGDIPFLNDLRTATNNTNFVMDTVTENDKPVYYFYYTGLNDETMKIVEPKHPTDPLFDHIDIPIYKKDYLGVFDQPYEIILEAEGIPVAAYRDEYPDGLTVNIAKAQFSGNQS